MNPMSYVNHKCRTNFLLASIATFAIYTLFIEPSVRGRNGKSRSLAFDDDDIDLAELEQELDCFNPVHLVEYRSPLDENIFKPRDDIANLEDGDDVNGKRSRPVGRFNDFIASIDQLPARASSAAIKFHRVWTMADRLIDRHGLWPNGQDRPEVAAILDAIAMAPIVGVDILDIGDYESGTSDKWIATLLGGQKVVMKVEWGDKGQMKKNAQCNTGYEMPTAEIAAFHLHRVIGFNNTPYVTGRRVDILREILPHASSAIAKQVAVRKDNSTCLIGTCYNCKSHQMLCRRDAIFDFSLAYWVPRKMRSHTFPPKYMPFSTPRMDEWGNVGFNNRSYCDLVQKTIEPYEQKSFYLDLFDFAVVDTLMYHYDSKHYSIVDKSEADGLAVRLDHGRAFCAHDRDDEHVFLAPVTQCCTIRKSTYKNLQELKNGQLTKKLRALLHRDPLAPVLEDVWFRALERRLSLILATLNKCISANGLSNVVVDSR